MDRQYEFVRMYYNWIRKCLIEDKKYEVLAFFTLGCDICVRQQDLINITWEQVNYPYIYNIQIKKYSSIDNPKYYDSKEISENTYFTIINGCTKSNNSERLFKHNLQWYIEEIRNSCGDKMFNGHLMRNME